MCYERRRAEACVDESAHHALVNAGGRELSNQSGIFVDLKIGLSLLVVSSK